MGSMLVTGGAGFIGANFVEYWLGAHPGDRVVVLDALTYAGNRASLQAVEGRPGFEFVTGDICDGGLVATLIRGRAVSTIVHFAAESHVDRSIVGPEEFLRTNVLGTQSLLQAARSVWMPDGKALGPVRFHHISTDEVYGSLGPADPAFSERTPYAPNSPYAASKAASDHLVRAYHHTYGLPVTTSNCSNNYGPYQFPEKLIPLMIVNALEGKALPVYGDGGNVRDWLYVTDHCRAIERVLLEGRVGETYNVGGGNEWPNVDVVHRLCAALDTAFAADRSLPARFPACPAAKGRPVSELVTFVKDRPGHDRRYAVDTTKVERELGVTPEESFESGLRKTVAWYLEHEAWWRGVMDGSYRDWVQAQYGDSSAARPAGAPAPTD
ncbi:MAG: dTDP-glucose 4,6-dehydratase [Gemmatimonadales bacterium]|nr:dTDP-glucose 4,6-dehydratase [Gemmatimonadales bacterium]